MIHVIKRDGRTVEFDESKIVAAIAKAMAASGMPDDGKSKILAEQVSSKFFGIPSATVEEIQDTVEAVLIENGLVHTAKRYILYRAERSKIREANTRLMKTFEGLTFQSAKENDGKRENANINGDTAMGTMLKYGSEGAKMFYELCVLNPEHSRMHAEGDIHIHDLDFYTLTTTCCQIDLTKLFTGGFSTGEGYLREPNDIASYASLACIAIQSNQNDQHGGQSIPKFDYDLAVGVRKTYRKKYRSNLFKALELLGGVVCAESEQKAFFQHLAEQGHVPALTPSAEYRAAERAALQMYTTDEAVIEKAQNFAEEKASRETDRATYQAMEALIHNLNTMHSRAGAQVPFSSINYGMDTSVEGRMVIRNVLLATEAGLGQGETPIFPVQIFKVKEGVNFQEGEPNYDLFQLALRVSAKRLFPNFSFIDAPFNLKYYKGTPDTEIAYMGCRTRVIANTYDPTQEIIPGRGNLSFTSVNLPRLAIKSNRNIEIFYEMLDRCIDVVIDQLLERFKIQCNKHIRNYPFLMGQGIWLESDTLREDETLDRVLKHGTLTCGFIGLAECLKFLLGVHHGESAEAQNIGLEIISHMRSRMDQASKQYGLNFSLIATPAEGLSGRFVKLDKKRYGIIEGVTDREYYTNSFHIPVYFPISAFEKIKLEAPYHALTNGGHITYVEMDGDPLLNLKAFEKIVRCMHDSGIGYGAINHPVDRDPVCGFTGIINDECPHCGRKESTDLPFERIRRITGYLVGTLDRFNNAKRAEEADRVKHTLGTEDL